MIKIQANSSFERIRLKILISCITQEFTAVPRFGTLFIYLVSVKLKSGIHFFFRVQKWVCQVAGDFSASGSHRFVVMMSSNSTKP